MSTATRNGRATTPQTAVPAPKLTRPPRRRQPAYVALGLALALTGGVASATLTTGASQRSPVLAVFRGVPAGARISAGDLTTVRVGADSGVTTIAAGDRNQIVGRVAAVTLSPGELLSPAMVSAAAVPAPGQQLVGVALKPGQYPASGLAPGDAVTLISTPGNQATQPVAASPIDATVHAVGPPDANGTVVVDLLVAASDGAAVAQQASTGRVALLIQPAGG